MKRLLPLALLLAVTAGCTSTPGAQSLPGLYAMLPVREDPAHFHWTDGQNRVVTTQLTLTLYPNGRFSTWSNIYYDGELVRFSGLAAYDLRSNSQGTWRYADGRIFLRSDGPAYPVTQEMLQQTGRTITPETSEAKAAYREGYWVLDWQGALYSFKDKAPEPTQTAATAK